MCPQAQRGKRGSDLVPYRAKAPRKVPLGARHIRTSNSASSPLICMRGWGGWSSARSKGVWICGSFDARAANETRRIPKRKADQVCQRNFV